MIDIYDIKSVIDFLPFMIFLSLLSLIILIIIYALLSKIFFNKYVYTTNVIAKNNEYDFDNIIKDLESNIHKIDNKTFIKKTHLLYSKYLSYKYKTDLSSKTLEEIQKLNIINADESDILSLIYKNEYSLLNISDTNISIVFDVIKDQIINNKK